MNKRSAMAIAAGLVLALMVAAAAVSLDLEGPKTAAAGTARSARNPVARTTHRTVTVHRDPKGSPTARTVVIGSGSAPANTSASSESDDRYEHGSGGTDDRGSGPLEGGGGSGGGDD